MTITMFDLTDAEQWAREMGLSPTDLPTQIKCFDEEANEFTDSSSAQDELDALADMLQVIASIKVCGGDVTSFYDHFEQCWLMTHFSRSTINAALAEVVRSNYSKFVDTEAKAFAETMRYHIYRMSIGYSLAGVNRYKITSLKDQTVNGKFYPKGKVLKPISFFEPNLEQFL